VWSSTVSTRAVCADCGFTSEKLCLGHTARKESRVTRKIAVNNSAETNQALAEDGCEGEDLREPSYLSNNTQSLASSFSPNRNAPSKRECEVVRQMAEGKSNKETAPFMNISVRTVETYRSRIIWKLDIHSAAHFIRYAMQNKLADF